MKMLDFYSDIFFQTTDLTENEALRAKFGHIET